MRVRFGECVLDSGTRQLSVHGGAVHLSPKAFQFLELLLQSRPRALSKSEIHERLWPGTFVSGGTLTSLLAEVRSATGDSARDSRFVRTVHRFGYAFSGTAEEVRGGDSAVGDRKLVYRLIWGNREIALSHGENLFGRDENAAVWIDDALVSRRHARIVIDETGAAPGRSRQQERDVPAGKENRSPHEARRPGPGVDRAGLYDLPHLQAHGFHGSGSRAVAVFSAGGTGSLLPRLVLRYPGRFEPGGLSARP